jgi:hypothetical protein
MNVKMRGSACDRDPLDPSTHHPVAMSDSYVFCVLGWEAGENVSTC